MSGTFQLLNVPSGTKKSVRHHVDRCTRQSVKLKNLQRFDNFHSKHLNRKTKKIQLFYLKSRYKTVAKMLSVSWFSHERSSPKLQLKISTTDIAQLTRILDFLQIRLFLASYFFAGSYLSFFVVFVYYVCPNETLSQVQSRD